MTEEITSVEDYILYTFDDPGQYTISCVASEETRKRLGRLFSKLVEISNIATLDVDVEPETGGTGFTLEITNPSIDGAVYEEDTIETLKAEVTPKDIDITEYKWTLLLGTTVVIPTFRNDDNPRNNFVEIIIPKGYKGKELTIQVEAFPDSGAPQTAQRKIIIKDDTTPPPEEVNIEILSPAKHGKEYIPARDEKLQLKVNVKNGEDKIYEYGWLFFRGKVKPSDGLDYSTSGISQFEVKEKETTTYSIEYLEASGKLPPGEDYLSIFAYALNNKGKNISEPDYCHIKILPKEEPPIEPTIVMEKPAKQGETTTIDINSKIKWEVIAPEGKERIKQIQWGLIKGKTKDFFEVIKDKSNILASATEPELYLHHSSTYKDHIKDNRELTLFANALNEEGEIIPNTTTYCYIDITEEPPEGETILRIVNPKEGDIITEGQEIELTAGIANKKEDMEGTLWFFFSNNKAIIDQQTIPFDETGTITTAKFTPNIINIEENEVEGTLECVIYFKDGTLDPEARQEINVKYKKKQDVPPIDNNKILEILSPQPNAKINENTKINLTVKHLNKKIKIHGYVWDFISKDQNVFDKETSLYYGEISNQEVTLAEISEGDGWIRCQALIRDGKGKLIRLEESAVVINVTYKKKPSINPSEMTIKIIKPVESQGQYTTSKDTPIEVEYIIENEDPEFYSILARITKKTKESIKQKDIIYERTFQKGEKISFPPIGKSENYNKQEQEYSLIIAAFREDNINITGAFDKITVIVPEGYNKLKITVPTTHGKEYKITSRGQIPFACEIKQGIDEVGWFWVEAEGTSTNITDYIEKDQLNGLSGEKSFNETFPIEDPKESKEYIIFAQGYQKKEGKRTPIFGAISFIKIKYEKEILEEVKVNITSPVKSEGRYVITKKKPILIQGNVENWKDQVSKVSWNLFEELETESSPIGTAEVSLDTEGKFSIPLDNLIYPNITNGNEKFEFIVGAVTGEKSEPAAGISIRANYEVPELIKDLNDILELIRSEKENLQFRTNEIKKDDQLNNSSTHIKDLDRISKVEDKIQQALTTFEEKIKTIEIAETKRELLLNTLNKLKTTKKGKRTWRSIDYFIKVAGPGTPQQKGYIIQGDHKNALAALEELLRKGKDTRDGRESAIEMRERILNEEIRDIILMNKENIGNSSPKEAISVPKPSRGNTDTQIGKENLEFTPGNEEEDIGTKY